MKTTLKYSLYILSVMVILTTACSHKQFGYLNKVRVKQNPTQETVKNSKEATLNEEEKNCISASEEELISATSDTTAILLGSNKNLIGVKPNGTKDINKDHKKQTKTFRNYPKDKKQYDSPNIPAYIAIALSVISSAGMLFDLFVLDEGIFFIIGMLMAIPILVLGIIGLKNYTRERAKDGYIASIISIIYSSIILLIFLILIIFLVIEIISYFFF